MQNTPHYVIRRANTSDVEAILRVHAKSWLDTYPNEELGISEDWVRKRVERWHSAENIEKRRALIDKSSTDPNYLYLVGENDKKEIVAIAAPFRDVTVQRVGALYVDVTYHGTGIATELMKRIIAWSDPSRPLELEVAAYNDRAKAFYKKHGFVEQPGSEHIIKEVMPVVTMIREGDAQ